VLAQVVRIVQVLCLQVQYRQAVQIVPVQYLQALVIQAQACPQTRHQVSLPAQRHQVPAVCRQVACHRVQAQSHQAL